VPGIELATVQSFDEIPSRELYLKAAVTPTLSRLWLPRLIKKVSGPWWTTYLLSSSIYIKMGIQMFVCLSVGMWRV